MEIRLKVGDTLEVKFADSDDSDDGFKIFYGMNRKNRLCTTVVASYEDDSGRMGDIYSATFHDDPDDDEEGDSSIGDRNEVIKVIPCASCGTSFDFTKGEERFMKKVFKGSYRDPVRCPTCRKIRMSRRLVEEKGNNR